MSRLTNLTIGASSTTSLRLGEVDRRRRARRRRPARPSSTSPSRRWNRSIVSMICAAVATTVRTSAPVIARMSSTAKTFDGSAIATTRRAVLPADRDRLVAAGERLGDERRDRRVDRRGRRGRRTRGRPGAASVRTSSASEIVPCSISSRPSGLPAPACSASGRVELGLGEQSFGNSRAPSGVRVCPTGSASSSSRRGAIGTRRSCGRCQWPFATVHATRGSRSRCQLCSAENTRSSAPRSPDLRSSHAPPASGRDAATRPGAVRLLGLHVPDSADRAVRADRQPCSSAARGGRRRDDDFGSDRDRAQLDELDERAAQLEHAAAGAVREVAHRAPAVDLHDEAPRLRVDLEAARCRARRRARAGIRATGSRLRSRATGRAARRSRRAPPRLSAEPRLPRRSSSATNRNVRPRSGRRRSRCRPCARAARGRRSTGSTRSPPSAALHTPSIEPPRRRDSGVHPQRAGLARVASRRSTSENDRVSNVPWSTASLPTHCTSAAGARKLSDSTSVLAARRRTASRIAATGAGRPDHRSTWSAAWWTSMPRPSTGDRARGTGCGEQRRLERVVHEVGDDLPGARSAPAVDVAIAPVAHADRGRVDDDVGLGRGVGAVGPGDRGRAGERGGRRRGVGPPGRDRDRDAGPASASARTTGRAAPPAPSTSAARPAGSTPGFAERPDEAFAVGRVAVQRAVGEHGHRVDTAQRGGVVGELVARGRGRGLVRHRDREADETRGARTRRAPPRSAPSGTSNATYTQSSPSSRYAVLCSSGDSECRTGSPMMPASRVRRPLITAGRPPAPLRCSARALRRSPRTCAGLRHHRSRRRGSRSPPGPARPAATRRSRSAIGVGGSPSCT